MKTSLPAAKLLSVAASFLLHWRIRGVVGGSARQVGVRGLLRQIERLLRKQIPQARGLPSFPDVMAEPRMESANFNDNQGHGHLQGHGQGHSQDRPRSGQRGQSTFERPDRERADRPVHASREPGTRFPKNRAPVSQERVQHPLDGGSLSAPSTDSATKRNPRNFAASPVARSPKPGFKGKGPRRGPR